MKKKNLSQHNSAPTLKNKNVKIGIVVSEWNETITGALKEGALAFLSESGIAKNQIFVHTVPGSYELPFAAAALLDADDSLNAVICLGCVIQGETRHFEFISQAVANGIMNVSLDYGVPVIFGVLTCDTMEQAQERAGGKHGNKGVEAAHTCLKMLELQQKIN
ncbi:MAG: 6,7-dimethyl-8-ribityllumazine synthase [Bacteroidetes bacterium]|nr:6,7-dimethyl-8-ribityllumazine synthase [Bacteroidota bacterium]MCL2302797.1 6,7-dimethyl-8-ribityllumazine synthase [Lentimicrobiaceae bacterium]